MNIDRKRHKLLGILTEQRKNVELKKKDYDTLGVPFTTLYEKLKCDEDCLHSITSELYSLDEIKYHDANQIIGLYVRPLGMTAFTNKKYLKRINARRKDFVKFWIVIFAFFISCWSFYNSTRKIDKSELNELKVKIDTMKTQLNRMKLELNDKLKFSQKKDTLSSGSKIPIQCKDN